ncbi:MAG TPA: hypothetical protein VNX21_02185, partial [Candidatus Thermoplasmatota archaeon]|nr:hypothetical protein [Candidatus Thermoplasmatota archaeon]
GAAAAAAPGKPELTPAQRELVERVRALSDEDFRALANALLDVVPRDVICDGAADMMRGKPDEIARLALAQMKAMLPEKGGVD